AVDALSACRRVVLAFFDGLFWPAPGSALFPYTTLFRSSLAGRPGEGNGNWRGPREGGAGRDFARGRLRDLGRGFNAETGRRVNTDRKSTRLNSSHDQISYAVFCLKKKTKIVRAADDKRP